VYYKLQTLTLQCLAGIMKRKSFGTRLPFKMGLITILNVDTEKKGHDSSLMLVQKWTSAITLWPLALYIFIDFICFIHLKRSLDT
jgi:hypothetical protein